jgi:hypothetical protein
MGVAMQVKRFFFRVFTLILIGSAITALWAFNDGQGGIGFLAVVAGVLSAAAMSKTYVSGRYTKVERGSFRDNLAKDWGGPIVLVIIAVVAVAGVLNQ